MDYVAVALPTRYTHETRAWRHSSTCKQRFTCMNEPAPDEESEAPDSRRGALIGFGVVLLLIVGGLVLAHVLRSTSQMQDCVMSGRTNCAPIDTSNSDNHGSN